MKKFVLLLSLLFTFAIYAISQSNSYSRNMEVHIVSVNHFEESRIRILQSLDSIDMFPVQLYELKEVSKPMLFELTFYTNDKGFNKFDTQLSSWGHIKTVAKVFIK